MVKTGAAAGARRTPTNRLLVWLLAGVVSGLAIGFVFGLTKPRPRVV